MSFAIRRLAPIAILALACTAGADSIDVHNNHDFPVRMPYTLHDVKQTTFFLDLPAHAHQSVDTAAIPAGDAQVTIQPADNAASLSFKGQSLGQLSWSLVLHTVTPATTKNDALSAGRPADFKPQPLTLSFKQTATAPLFTTYSASTTSNGLQIQVDLDVYPTGFLDVRTKVTNQSAPKKDVYAAILTNWTQAGVSSRTCDYNSAVSDLKDSTPWRMPGGRHQFVARGLNWFTTTSPAGSVLWLNEFAPSFTIHHQAKGKTPAEWVGANSAQLDQEAYVDGDTLIHVTELAHGSVKSYRSRLDDYVLPDPSQPLTFTHRLVFADKPISNDDSTHTFIAYTTYNSQPNPTRLDLGVPYVTFGTAYFPYSTLGENFGPSKLPGMSQDGYWPLAADVVKNYKLFANDIRRDLRIAKSMGFQSIRMHHMEMLWTTDKDVVKVTPEERNAFLDFFFNELKDLKLTALVDVKITPDQITDLLQRHREQIDGVEIDNEILIFGIQDKDIQYWKDCYAAVKKIAPDMPVHWTAQTNTDAFIRLQREGVPFDQLGEHAYMDGLDAIPMSRDFALQVASYGSTVNKPPTLTEWNWRFLTRMTEEARAKVYAPIFESPFKARAVPLMYQFQFNDSLAMNPLALKGIRHYELLNLSRRPKEEASEFQRLVNTYSAPDSTTRTLKLERTVVDLPADAPSKNVTIPMTNQTDKTLHLTCTFEAADGMKPLATKASITLEPGQTGNITSAVSIPADAPPGFYHSFWRMEDEENHILRYAWIEARRPGQPTFDKSAHNGVTCSKDAFDLDLTKPTAIVYGDDCPIMELEASWVIYQTLESACGVPVKIFTARELPPSGVTNLIYIGTAKSLPASTNVPADKQGITRLPGSNTLVISGDNSQDAALAAMDYTLRYWKTAKDSACRRVPLVTREISKGPDAGQLP
ncbi:MAG TPA: hypothetical protein VFE58_17800 [Tepidisphaeraceae bacterium]|jgi:hypothetical protein|nr:hypothetical protein [Tepidisphaeraceae bacterium]